jgi:hypothetical protein
MDSQEYSVHIWNWSLHVMTTVQFDCSACAQKKQQNRSTLPVLSGVTT